MDMEAITQKAKLVRDDSGQFILQKDGQATFCPYVAPFVVQSALGSPTLSRIPCTTSCPLVTFQDDYYIVGCGANRVKYIIQEVIG
jgi:hypothetical protein